MSQDVTVGMRQELVFFSSYCPPIAPLFPPPYSPPLAWLHPPDRTKLKAFSD